MFTLVRPLKVRQPSRPSCIAPGLFVDVAGWPHWVPPRVELHASWNAEIGMVVGMGAATRTEQVRPDRCVIEGHCGLLFMLARALFTAHS